MKKLRNGYTTGSCAAAAALASVLWQTSDTCPEMVTIETPGAVTLSLPIVPIEKYTCGVYKDSGDDPDQTNGCLVTAMVQPEQTAGEIRFAAGAGVGIVTKKGLKLPIGEPAINPVPRQMIEAAIRTVIGERSATVTISIPDGEKIAEKTFNRRLGIEGGLSILGTTGIVRPMSEEAVKDSLRLELSVYREEYGTACAFVTGYAGERYLQNRFQKSHGILLCSNHLGAMLDAAVDYGFTHILIAGRIGKLIKPAANIMHLHSHIAGGQREIICTHAALLGAATQQIQMLYRSNTTSEMQSHIRSFGLERIWKSILEAAIENCRQRVRNQIEIGMLLLDEEDCVLAETENLSEIMEVWDTI